METIHTDGLVILIAPACISSVHAPSSCSCAQSRNALIISIVELGGSTPGYVVCFRSRQFILKVSSQTHGKMNRMGIKADGLAFTLIMGSEGSLHVFQRRCVVDGIPAVWSIPISTQYDPRAGITFHTHNQGSIKCGPETPRSSKYAYNGISQNPGSLS